MQVKSSRQLFGEIEKAIQESGLSHRALLAKCKLSHGFLCGLQGRGGNLTTDALFALAKELNIKVSVER
jgi:hypothetical protein